MRNGIKNLLMAMLYAFVLSATLLAMILLVSAVSRADDVVVQKLRVTTVRVNGGSGSIVKGKSGKKYILTNWHVCTMPSLTGTFLHADFDDSSTVGGEIVANDSKVDLCAARLTVYNPPALTISPSDGAKNLYTRGYPNGVIYEGHGTAKTKIEWSYRVPIEYLSSGQCPENSQAEYYQNGEISACILHWISTLTTLYSRPGSSGSPVLDGEGRLVGVMSSQDPNHNDFAGGMVSTEDLRAFLDKL